MKTCIVALLLVSSGGLARATTLSCTGMPDGAECQDSCRRGTCANQLCSLNANLPDGTGCATGNTCTTDDACVAGQCSAGAAVPSCKPGDLPDLGDQGSCKPVFPDGGTQDDKLKGGGGCSAAGGGSAGNGWLVLMVLLGSIVMRRRANAS